MTQTGLDILLKSRFAALKGQKLGLLAHGASVDAKLQHILNHLLGEKSARLVRVFAPEHGIYGAKQDMIEVSDVDSSHNVPAVISLYGSSASSLVPLSKDLQDLDCLLVDLQDVGSRYYTYAQTLAYTLSICRDNGVKVIVLDRPNPIGGLVVEGSPLEASCQSFCGMAPVANRHGLTIGELAHVYNEGMTCGGLTLAPINCDLEVITMSNWARSMLYSDTKLHWVLPSPNMPSLETALVYPGACLFEATECSEGRGTTKPFELIGAPWIDGAQTITFLEKNLRPSQWYRIIKGCVLRPLVFEPQFQKHAGRSCGGLQIHITNPQKFKSYRLYLYLIWALYKQYPAEFEWRKGTYEFIDDVPAIDLLYGNSHFRNTIESGGTPEDLEDEMAAFENEYTEVRQKYLLY